MPGMIYFVEDADVARDIKNQMKIFEEISTTL
jgi:hypothetical protein